MSVKWTNVASLRAQLVRPEIVTRLQGLLLQGLQKVECMIGVTRLEALTHTELVYCVREHRVTVDGTVHGDLVVRQVCMGSEQGRISHLSLRDYSIWVVT